MAKRVQMVSLIKEKSDEWQMIVYQVRHFCVKHKLVITKKTIHMLDDKVVKNMIFYEGNLDE